MSIFAQHKSRGPPTPPRRGDVEKPEKQEEEWEEEYGGMYEAPPSCERPVKVPQIPLEENIYLERTSNPFPPNRQAPCPRPPEVNRSDKPGKKKKDAPPTPQSSRDEDVYLEPDAEDSSEEVYLEPQACSPPRESKMMASLPKRAVTKPLLKPPVPGDKSSLLRDGGTVNKTGHPPTETRPFSFPPPPTKPSLSINKKERAPSPQELTVTDNKRAVPSAGRNKSSSENMPYLAGDCNRKTAEDLLQSMKKDGTFLIRYSSTRDPRQPYTLAVWYQQKVYNVPIRFLEKKQGYALGKEGKKNEEIFVSLDDMITHHKNNQLLLIDSKTQAKYTTYLTFAAHQ